MTALSDAFQTALAQFQRKLTEKEREKFQYAKFEDVQRELYNIQRKQENLKEMVNLNRIQLFLEGMNQFGQVIEVFLNASNYVGYVWGPVKFILQVWLLTFIFRKRYHRKP